MNRGDGIFSGGRTKYPHQKKNSARISCGEDRKLVKFLAKGLYLCWKLTPSQALFIIQALIGFNDLHGS